MVLKVYVSFAGPSEPLADRIIDRLTFENFEVHSERNMGVDTPRKEMEFGIKSSDVMVLLVTEGLTESLGAEYELGLALTHNTRVVSVWCEIDPEKQAAYRSYGAHRQVRLREQWIGSEDQWDRLLRKLVDALRADDSRRTESYDVPRDIAPKQAWFLYDVEDVRRARELLEQNPGWRPMSSSPDAPETSTGEILPVIAFWTEASREPISRIWEQIERMSDRRELYILGDESVPVPQTLGGSRVVPATGTETVLPAAQQGVSAEESVTSGIIALLKLNEGVSPDVFVDRFFRDVGVGLLATRIADLAISELAPSNPLRTQAVYYGALAERFFGDWQEAERQIRSELGALAGSDLVQDWDYVGQLKLELIALQYEMGASTAAQTITSLDSLSDEFRRAGRLSEYVSCGCLIGNVQREAGSFDEAYTTTQRVIGVAEFLSHSDTEPDGVLILADCYRELAGLAFARLDSASGGEALSIARRLLEGHRAGDTAAAFYLLTVIDYLWIGQSGFDPVGPDAQSKSQAMYKTVVKAEVFDNPIRLASLFDALGNALARDIPRTDAGLVAAEAYLVKALRMRTSLKHDYTSGLSELSLGQLFFTRREFARSADHLKRARRTFNKRGLKPGLARADTWLARTAFEMARTDPRFEADAESFLQSAQKELRQIGRHEEALELKLELGHGRRVGLASSAPTDTVVAVGEFGLHAWIKDKIQREEEVLDRRFKLEVGVGDDAAVLRGPDSGAPLQLVVSTDSAPGALSLPGGSAEYAGRFAVVHSISDIIAMGAKPLAVLINVFLQRTTSVKYVQDLMSAAIDEATRNKVVVLGGDLKERGEQAIGCVSLGVASPNGVLKRSSAEPGDALCITLAEAPRGVASPRKIGARWAQELIETFRLDRGATVEALPGLEGLVSSNLKLDLLFLPTSVMLAAMETSKLHAGMDTSDGVLACLASIGKDSSVGFELEEAAINSTIDPRVLPLARMLGVAPAALMFGAGHDWEVVFTCADSDVDEIRTAVESRTGERGSIVRIGRVVARDSRFEDGVLFTRTSGDSFMLDIFSDEKFVPRRYQDRPEQWLKFASRFLPSRD